MHGHVAQGKEGEREKMNQKINYANEKPDCTSVVLAFSALQTSSNYTGSNAL
jgi:hypothetical protein